ncbi:MAG TPA: hypothetical protein VEN81_08415, partial [Planctomycetota bacterium]|nr:hypothetical protein [Planctomycetota bacterium]
IEPLLDGAVQAMASLFPLNRLRQPVVFDRLQGLPVSGSPDPSAFKAILALAAQAGLEVIDESEGVFESELRPPPCCYRDGGAATVAEAIEVLLFQGPCEAILEAGQLHILKREDALGFWRAWNQGG